VFAARGPRHVVGDRWVDLREIGAALNDRDAGLLTTAVALARWHDRHPRCPIDGTPTALVNGGWVRRCLTDGSEHFPRTDPAVIMLVHDGGDRCVLGRQAVWPEGRFSILAGFVEPGESAEQTVVREVAEEVGVVVSNLRYVSSQAWPYPGSLMLGFTAEGDPAAPLRPDTEEIADARWFTRSEILAALAGEPALDFGLPMPSSIAHFLISGWATGLH
jgi:NAD+ diphosphatase